MNTYSFTPFPVLKTTRLRLRQLQEKDEKQIFLLHSDPRVIKYIDRPVAKTIKDAQRHIRRMEGGVERDEWIYWAMALNDTDQLIGTICLWNFSADQTTADLGIELLPEFQGQGFMREALQEVLKYGFEMLQLTTIEAYTHAENTDLYPFFGTEWLSISKEDQRGG